MLVDVTRHRLNTPVYDYVRCLLLLSQFQSTNYKAKISIKALKTKCDQSPNS